jgi:hypothetical protein
MDIAGVSLSVAGQITDPESAFGSELARGYQWT